MIDYMMNQSEQVHSASGDDAQDLWAYLDETTEFISPLTDAFKSDLTAKACFFNAILANRANQHHETTEESTPV